MDTVTGNQTDERIEQLRQLLDTMQQPAAQEAGDDHPLMLSEAHDQTEQLGEYLRTLQNATTAKLDKIEKDGLANNGWLVQIDKTVKDFDWNLKVLGTLIAAVIIIPLIARSCGG